MKKYIKHFSPLLLLLVVLNGCETDDRDFTLEVRVTVDDGQVAAQNALVHIFAPVPNTTVNYYLYTDEDGVVSLTLKNKAIVDIVATKNPYRSCTFAEIDRGVKRVDLDMTIYGDPDSGCRDTL